MSNTAIIFNHEKVSGQGEDADAVGQGEAGPVAAADEGGQGDAYTGG